MEQRDDLFLERITLYNQVGHYKKAKKLIASYKFHPWEGGEGKVVGQYLICHIELAKQCIDEGNCQQAIELLEQAENYPLNLGEGKLTGVQENDIQYWKGIAYEILSGQEKASYYFQQATMGIDQPAQAIFYNDPQPDKIFYQGLAWAKLNNKAKSAEIFNRLICFGKEQMDDQNSIDYFAVSLPDLLVFDADLTVRNKIHCLYLMALGNLGFGNGHYEKVENLLDQVTEMDKNHQGAIIHKQMMKYMTLVES